MNKPNSTISAGNFQPPDDPLFDAILNIMQASLLLRRASARNLCRPTARLLRSFSDELRELTQPLLQIVRTMKAAEDDPEHIGSIAKREMAKWAAELNAKEAL